MNAVDHVRAAKSELFSALRASQDGDIDTIHKIERAIITVEMLEAHLILATIPTEEHST